MDEDAWGIRKMFQHGYHRWCEADLPRAPHPCQSKHVLGFLGVFKKYLWSNRLFVAIADASKDTSLQRFWQILDQYWGPSCANSPAKPLPIENPKVAGECQLVLAIEDGEPNDPYMNASVVISDNENGDNDDDDGGVRNATGDVAVPASQDQVVQTQFSSVAPAVTSSSSAGSTMDSPCPVDPGLGSGEKELRLAILRTLSSVLWAGWTCVF